MTDDDLAAILSARPAGLPETDVALLIWQEFEPPGEHSCNEHPPSGLAKGQYDAFAILGIAHADRSADPRYLNAAVSVTACPAPMPGRVGEIRSSHRSVPSLAGSHCI